MDQCPTVIVTGSTKGSRIAWTMSRSLLRLHGIHARFFHPGSWDADVPMDGLLITGGIDIDPKLYGAKRHTSIQKTDPARDAMEIQLLERAKNESLPVMGICRGMQLINLFRGGTLYPHIGDMDLDFHHPHTPLPLQTLEIKAQTHLHEILRRNTLRANALHHQTIDRIGNGLTISARDRNRLIQAIESKEERFILGLQWHPEFMPYHWSSRRIFHLFAAEIKKHKHMVISKNPIRS